MYNKVLDALHVSELQSLGETFLAIFSTWSVQVNDSSISTPRYIYVSSLIGVL